MQAKKQIIGDNLPKGLFKLHSSFERVVNYYHNDDLVSMVTPLVGASSIAVVVDEIPQDIPNEVIINDEEIIWGNQIINKQECLIYDAEPQIASLPQDVAFFINLAKPELLRSGLWFLFVEKYEDQTGFLKNFASKMQKATEVFWDNPKDAAADIKGMGFGLTPTGDDFLSGIIAALWLKNEIENLNIESLINQVYEASLGKNLLSNSFLKQAKCGKFFEQFKYLVISLAANNHKQFKDDAISLANIGDSSGSAMLAGLLWCLKSFNLPNRI